MTLLLLILAVFLVVAGVIRLTNRDWLFGTIFILIGLLVGPWSAILIR